MSLGHRRGSTRPSRAVNGAVVPLLLILSAIAGAAGPAIPVAEAAPATGDGAGTLPADSLAAARDDSLGALRTGEAPVDSTGQLPGMDANEESELQAAAEEKRPTMTPMQRALAHADSVVATAEADSIRADRDAVAETKLVPEGFNWFTSLAPTMKAEITSDVQKVVKNGSLSATTKWLDGGTSNTTWSLNNTSYRQQDRDRRNRALRAGFVHPLGGLADLHVDFDHNTSEDENRVSPTQTVSVDYEANTANLGLGGGRDLSEGFAHAWRLRGRFEDVTQDNRGTNNDRNLAAGGLTSYWQHRRDHLSLDGRYGYDRAGGSRQLRGRAQDATTTQDTLSTHLRLSGRRSSSLRFGFDKISFIEDRLDFSRNASGVIDTLNIPDDQKVGDERESRDTRILGASLQSRPLRRISLAASFDHSFTETHFVFNRQGILQRGRDRVDANLGLRYAEAGSLQVDFKWDDSYNDRRTRDDDVFRGRESRISKQASVQLDQAVSRRSDLSLKVSQLLDSSVFEESGNNNDRDRLVERYDATLTSRAIDNVTVNLAATLSVTRDINIAAERVGNNKEDRLYEVRGSYIYRHRPTGPANRANQPTRSFQSGQSNQANQSTLGFSFEQSYRLQIIFIDFDNSNDRDQFNKQGQLVNRVGYSWSQTGKFSLEYSVDFRKTGKRDTDELFRAVYRTDQRRFDHQVRGSITVPLPLMTLSVSSQRGFLREEQARRDIKEDRGRIRMKLSGTRKFWRNHATLTMNVERVLEFGPRVRKENEDYWVANSGLTVTF